MTAAIDSRPVFNPMPVPVKEGTIVETGKQGLEQAKESYLRKLATLVAHIYTTFSQISQSDRKEIVRLEQKYTIATLDACNSTRTRGKLGVLSATVSLCVFAMALGLKRGGDQEFVKEISRQIPQLANLFDKGYEANYENKKAIAGLEMNKMQEKNNRAQSEGNIKEHFAQVLQAEIQRMRSAATGSN